MTLSGATRIARLGVKTLILTAIGMMIMIELDKSVTVCSIERIVKLSELIYASPYAVKLPLFRAKIILCESLRNLRVAL